MFKKIIIIGSPGAGKSTFARKLRDATGLPLHYLDMLWHKPDKTTVTREEFDVKLSLLLEGESWIMDGNFARTLEMRLSACDTVIYLDYPLDVCLSGVESRIGTKREDMPWIEEEFDPEFKKWIIEFPEKKRPAIYEALEKHGAGKNIIIFRTRAEAQSFLEKLSVNYKN